MMRFMDDISLSTVAAVRLDVRRLIDAALY
jgi:hypothetical protein